MASSSAFEAKVLMAKGKRAAAAHVHADCSSNPCPQHLNAVLDYLLDPTMSIEDCETVDWCNWLMAGGRTPEEFATTVRAYDNQTTCGLVWTPNFVAYRCRTCGMSPCMSLCTDCFKKGNHQRHDFNMFLSQAGGACDCGDTSVMKETGFCDRHGPDKSANKGTAPQDLMCVAEAMMPRILHRFLLFLRENSDVIRPLTESDGYISMLQDFNTMGALMRRVMTSALTNPQKYKDLNDVPSTSDNERECRKNHERALESLANPEPYERYRNCRALQRDLVHKTFLEELVFWTVYYEFPEKIVCLLLNMLPDRDYKEALMRAIVLHYSRISLMLEKTRDPENVSNRVVHATVQLFSNDTLALRMTEQMDLLHVMVISLRHMMIKILMLNIIHDPSRMIHMVVDCSKPVMSEHCYWPIVSDLNNVLSHRSVALHFMSDDYLIKMWFGFMFMFQGMNVNQKETKEHIRFDPNTYFAAFSCELEACAYTMWALVAHLTDASTAHLTKRLLRICEAQLALWLQMINFTGLNATDNVQVSFHLPLHRNYSVFLCQGVGKQGIQLDDVLPSKDDLKLMILHPLRLLISFYEILREMWKKNGLQMTGQAMTYIQGNFCNSMVDADIYLLQVACTRLCPNKFMSLLIDQFHVTEFLSLASEKPQNPYVQQPEHNIRMLESLMLFLATLVTVRTNIGLSETEVNRLEMVTLLCMKDRTHSQLMELAPERCGASLARDFETLLAELADYKPPVLNPRGGNLEQGMYTVKAHVWEDLYDPIYLMLRAVHRNDPTTAYNRYCNYVQSTKRFRPEFTPWLPLREPKTCSEPYGDPRLVLKSRVFHAAALVILHQAVQGLMTEQMMALIIFLLDQAVTISRDRQSKPKGTKASPPQAPVRDMNFRNWFGSDCIFENLRTVITEVTLTPASEISPLDYFCYTDDSEISEEEDVEMGKEDASRMTYPEDPLESYMVRKAKECHRRQAEELLQRQNTLTPPPPRRRRRNAVHYPAFLDLDARPAPRHPARPVRERQEEPLNFRSDFAARQAHIEPEPSTSRDFASVASPSSSPSTSTSPSPTTSTSASSSPSVSTSPPAQPLEIEIPTPSTVEFKESIISLLLRLHSLLSGVPNSYKSEEAESSDSESNMIGDGPFFIGRLLKKIAKMDEACKEYIQTEQMRLWPTQDDEEEKKREKEDRKRRAEERRAKVMADMANRQKEFMEMAMETDENAFDSDDEPIEVDEATINRREYDCIICNKSSPSYEDKPMGLVVFLQSTNVSGQRRKNGHGVLPTSEEELALLQHDVTLYTDFLTRLENLSTNFNSESWYLAVGVGWESGVYVQTCGHYAHLECLNPYLVLLNRPDYECPLCKTLSNAVLPIMPDVSDPSQPGRSNRLSMSQVVYELRDFLHEGVAYPPTSPLVGAIGSIMETVMGSVHLKPSLTQWKGEPLFQSLSLARTNLETELSQRGGTLVTSHTPNLVLPKRDCIGHLLHMLAVHARGSGAAARWPAWTTFQQLRGMSPKPPSDIPSGPVENEIPLVFKDPVSVLLQFILLLPRNLDQNYFRTAVQMVYNLLYYQVVTQLSFFLSAAQRANAAGDINQGMICTFANAIALVNKCLAESALYLEDERGAVEEVNMAALEQQVQMLCLPYMRIAALLKCHFYQIPLPEIEQPETEFVCLVHYLELGTEHIDWDGFNAATALSWPADTQMYIMSPVSWFSQYAIFIHKNQLAARTLLVEHHLAWNPARLLQLPDEYEKIFTFYHKRRCIRCNAVPLEAVICLMCGTIICLRQNCCRRENKCEATAHSIACGAGTGIFLNVTSTYTLIIRGLQACLWGSLYLDEFGEEDKDLKRGKPLYLCKERFQLLEQQWLAHRFEHIKKNWVYHSNTL